MSDYALIFNGIVKEIAFGDYYGCDQVAKQVYGETAFAVEVWSHYYPPSAQIPTVVNDTYSNGKFYHNGVEVQSVPTESELIANLTAQMNNANESIDDLIIAITPTEAN